MPLKNQPLGLKVQLYDGASGLFPLATIYLPDKSVYATLALTEAANGLYVGDGSVLMPDEDSVIAQYEVFTDSGHTTPAPQYTIDADTFELTPAPDVAVTPSVSPLIGIFDPTGCAEQNCEPSPIQDTLIKGSDRLLTLRIVRADNGEPFDLTGFTEIQVRLWNADLTVLTISSEDLSGPISIVTAAGGKFTCAITEAQSALLLFGNPAGVEVVIIIAGNKSIVQLGTQLAVVDRYFT